METNPNIQSTMTTSFTPAAQSTDWAAVRAYYLTCRSYKQTAEKFGVSIPTIKNRAIRGNWASIDTPTEVSGASIDTPTEVSGASIDTPTEVSGASIDTPTEVSGDGFDTPTEVSGASIDTPTEVSGGGFNTPTEVSGGGIDTPTEVQGAEIAPPDAPPPPALPPAMQGIQLPCISNFQAQEVKMLAPWAASVRKRSSFPDKDAFKAYLAQADTQDCLYSGVLGMYPLARACKDNPPTRMVAIVADYDMPLTREARARKLAKLAIKPNFLETSFSGGTHAVWLLEKPIPVFPDSGTQYAVLKAAAKDLHLVHAFGVLDETAFYNPSQYYTVGSGWTGACPDPVPASRCELWVQEGMKYARKNSVGGAAVPIERVWAEMQRRGWASRWNGDFEIGSRGVRFWDETADNPTAAIVTENGMVCWTGPFPFRSWKDIFGPDFVADHAAGTMGRAIADFYYIGGSYWWKDESGKWGYFPRRETCDILQNEYGLSARTPEDGTGSEVGRALSSILTRKRLDGALPMLFNEAETVERDGSTYLNTSNARALQPATGTDTTKWGDGFPWIARLLENLFGREDAAEQLDYFLSWLARAYQGALAHKPTRGQAIYIAGRTGCGKSFLSKHIIAPLFGGREEATSFLMSETRFNSNLFGKAIWSIDDAEIVAEPKLHARYTALVKKLVANSDFISEAKFQNAVKVPWLGRIVVTCNTDPESLGILPSVDMSNADKLMFFLCRDDTQLNDPQAEETAARELPSFAAFLAGYEIPEACRGTHRFGVVSYMHPLLKAEACNNGSSGTFKDVFELFLRNYFTLSAEGDLRGTACEIYEQMCSIETMRELMKGLVTPSSIGTRLGQLVSRGSFPLEKYRTSTRREWIVRREAFNTFATSNETSICNENNPF